MPNARNPAALDIWTMLAIRSAEIVSFIVISIDKRVQARFMRKGSVISLELIACRYPT